jgi:hypothetical protein
MARMPVSMRCACGSSWRRTRELAPSAPISTSALAVLPLVNCGDPPADAGLVALEGRAQAHDVVHARQQHLAQADPADAVVARFGAAVRGDLVGAQAEQVVKALGGEAEAAAVNGDGVQERLPRVGRKAVVQCPAAMRVDVDAVALQPVGAGLGACQHPGRPRGR